MSSAGCNAGCQSLAPLPIALSITSWSRWSHSSTTCWRSSSMSVILWCLYTRSCRIPMHRVVDGVQIKTVRRPQRGRNEKITRRGRDCFWNTNMLDFQILQGSVATQLRWGGSLYNWSIENFLGNFTVKELWKLVFICQRYDQKTNWLFFGTRCSWRVNSTTW